MKMTMTPIREKLGELPLWAQVSIASRSVRRAVLAAAPDNEKRLLVRALDAMDCCVEYGSWEPREERALQAVSSRRERGEPGTRALRDAAFWAVDACLAAESAHDFPADGAVTRSAGNAIETLVMEPRFSSPQVIALAFEDVELLWRSVREIRLMIYAPVPGRILARLPGIRPLDLAAAHVPMAPEPTFQLACRP